MTLTKSGRFLLVGDNHERVRISSYPQARLRNELSKLAGG